MICSNVVIQGNILISSSSILFFFFFFLLLFFLDYNEDTASASRGFGIVVFVCFPATALHY